MTGLRFDQPAALLALLIVPALILWRRARGRTPVLVVPYAAAWGTADGWRRRDWRIVALHAALALAVIALARPQRVESRRQALQRGYDIMLAVDLSTSMLAEDYTGPKGRLSRLETVRPVLRAFIAGRPHDRIGVVVFARRALTLAPLTIDHDWLLRQVAGLKIGLIEDSTAIGDALGIALADLEAGRGDKRAVGAFVVLLTDGANTAGTLQPPESTAIARHRDVPVYTVGTGRNGMVPFPSFDAAGRRTGTTMMPSSLDIDALKTISAETGGHFYRADDTRAVSEAFHAIDDARKAAFSVRTELKVGELFAWPAGVALALLLAVALAAEPNRLARTVAA